MIKIILLIFLSFLFYNFGFTQAVDSNYTINRANFNSGLSIINQLQPIQFLPSSVYVTATGTRSDKIRFGIEPHLLFTAYPGLLDTGFMPLNLADPTNVSSVIQINARGLQAVTINAIKELDNGKAGVTHVHDQSDVTGLAIALGAKEATSNKGAASGYASLDAGTKIPIAQIPTGATSSTVTIGNDARLSDARTPAGTNVVPNTMLAQMATKTYKGRTSAGTGNAEDVAVATLKTDLSLTATDVSLGNVTNESKATMFTSPTFTGTPLSTTPAFGDNTTKIPTTAYVIAANPVFARVTGSNVTTTGQSLVDITGLSVALAINSVYEIEVVISASTTAVTTGTGYGINYSVAGGAIEAHITGSFTSTASKTERITTLNTATSAFLTTSAQTGGICIRGIVTTGANAGNLTAKHLKVTSGTSTIFINSFIKVRKIG